MGEKIIIRYEGFCSYSQDMNTLPPDHLDCHVHFDSYMIDPGDKNRVIILGVNPAMLDETIETLAHSMLERCIGCTFYPHRCEGGVRETEGALYNPKTESNDGVPVLETTPSEHLGTTLNN